MMQRAGEGLACARSRVTRSRPICSLHCCDSARYLHARTTTRFKHRIAADIYPPGCCGHGPPITFRSRERVEFERLLVITADPAWFMSFHGAFKRTSANEAVRSIKRIRAGRLAWASGLMKGLIAVLSLSLCGCATVSRPVDESLSLHVDSYNPVSGKYTLTLRNNSLHSVLFLHYLVTYSATPNHDPVGRPHFPQDGSVLLHDRLLEPESTFQIEGTCSPSGACRDLGMHAGIYACWFNSRRECDQYRYVWSDTALDES